MVLVDFGLAKPERKLTSSSDDEAAGDVSRSGEVKGTPAYMSPEQANGESGGPLADVHRLGAAGSRGW